MKIAVTGTIGSGKTTFVEALKSLLPGFMFFSADTLVQELYALPDFKQVLFDRFGSSDRKVVSQRVFESPDDRKWLEAQSLCHVEGLMRDALSNAQVVFEYPLLFELGWHLEEFDFIITVTCAEAQQGERVVARDGVSDAKVQAVIASQCSREVKTALADFVVQNTGDRTALLEQAEHAAWAVKSAMLSNRAMTLFAAHPIWDALHTAYTSRHGGKGYHNLRHLAAMFEHYDRHQDCWAYPKAVALAIFFHDYVYRTEEGQAPLNEARSAHEMFQLIRRHAPALLQVREHGEPIVTVAAEMILATVKHSVPTAFFGSRPEAAVDCARFLDVDLSILLEGDARYFEQGVRTEYAHIPADVYQRERVRILNSFLCRERIFLSPEFSAQESLARANLKALIHLLESEGTMEALNA